MPRLRAAFDALPPHARLSNTPVQLTMFDSADICSSGKCGDPADLHRLPLGFAGRNPPPV